MVMKIVGERLRELRLDARYSQQQLADKCETTQATIGRYETDMADPPLEKLLWFAEFFDVSLDYIFGRTDNRKGMLPKSDSEALRQALPEDEDLVSFAEMCFAPGTKLNDRLKKTIIEMLREVKNK